MKNKKLFMRLFALLASLVLVFALALPCFADETDPPPTDYLYKRVFSYSDILLLKDLFYIDVSCIVKESLEVDSYFIAKLNFDVATDSFIVYYERITNDSFVTMQLVIDSSDNISFIVIYSYFDGSVETYNYSLDWGSVVLYILVPATADDVNSSIPSSDMYTNLFNILKDAVYGSDPELTGSQEYALTLMSTILTYATILLPVILVIFIAVWCFKRF